MAATSADGNWEIEIAGVRVKATASLAPFYDPRNLRIREGGAAA